LRKWHLQLANRSNFSFKFNIVQEYEYPASIGLTAGKQTLTAESAAFFSRQIIGTIV
jgi:hypothetical protein